MKFLVTRRRAVLAGGGVAAIAIALATSRSGDSRLKALSGVNLAAAKDLGDGFFEVDGWILTAEDIRKLGGRPPQKAE